MLLLGICRKGCVTESRHTDTERGSNVVGSFTENALQNHSIHI